jgi:hypothetical protein
LGAKETVQKGDVLIRPLGMPGYLKGYFQQQKTRSGEAAGES